VVVCLWVGISGRCRLDSGSLSISCLEFVVSGVGLFRSRLWDVDGEGWGVVVVRFLSSMRWDLRVVLAWAVVWRGGGGQGRVMFVFLISCMSSWTLGLSSPVRV
jgi:hypothetical protein